MSPSWLWSRPLAPLTAALAAGIAAPSLGLSLRPPWSGLGAAALLLVLALMAWRRLPVAGVGCLLFFLLGQGLWHTALHPSLPGHHVRFLPQKTPLSIIGTVQSQPILSGADYRLELAAASWSTGKDWRPACGTIWLSGGAEAASLQPGDRIAVRLMLRPVADLKNPEGTGRTLALARRQIFVTGRIWHHLPPVLLVSASSRSGWVTWREQAQAAVRTFLAAQPQPARSVFLALLLGDQREISPPLRQALQRTGTSHLMAVSGLHLAMIAGTAFTLIFWLLRRSAWLLLRLNALKTAVLLSLLPVLAYSWLAGGSPATQRATLMLLAGALLVLLDRHRDLSAALVLAAFVILVASPLQFYAPSFQLSFLAVWGLIGLAPVLIQPCRIWLAGREKLPGWVRQAGLGAARGLAVTLAATLATLPAIVASFHQAPTYGIIINLVAVPLIGSLALPLSFLAVIVSGLPGPLASGLLVLSRQVVEFTLYIIHQAAALPGVVVRLPGPTALQTVAYFVALVSLFRAPRRFWRWTGVSLGALVLAGTVAWSNYQSTRHAHLVLTALDTPGDLALAATLPGGRTLVVTAGRPRYFDSHAANTALIGHLHAQKLLRLDFLAALTVTRENAPTLLALAQEFAIGQFWSGGERQPIQSFWEFRNLLGDQGREVRNLAINPLDQEIDGVLIRSRQLPRATGSGRGGPVLLLVTCHGQELLILPPAPRSWQDQCLAAGLPPAAVAIIPATYLRPDFLEPYLRQVNPRQVIVTGSPPEELPTLIANTTSTTWRFTRQGAVRLDFSAQGLEISQWRP